MEEPAMRSAPIGYWYWHMQRIPFGWRQIGPEAHCVMDDFGSLVFVGDGLWLDSSWGLK